MESANNDFYSFASQVQPNQGPLPQYNLKDQFNYSLSSAVGELTEVAAMAYGSGIFEGAGGGKGHIGLLNGKVIKFNTHSNERDAVEKMGAQGEAYAKMLEASDKLRISLVNSLNAVLFATKGGRFKDEKTSQSHIISKVAEHLGLKTKTDNGNVSFASNNVENVMQENRGLLTRTAAAKVVTLVRDFLRQHYPDQQTLYKANKSNDRYGSGHFQIWRNVTKMKDKLSSKSIKTDFAYVSAMSEAFKAVDEFKKKTDVVRDIRAAGNDVMKEALASSKIHLDYENGFNNPPKVIINNKDKFAAAHADQANGICRYFQTKAMVNAMDKMFAEFMAKSGSAREIEAAFGKTPFTTSFNSIMATISKKELKKGIDAYIKGHEMPQDVARSALNAVFKTDEDIVAKAEKYPLTFLEFSPNRNRVFVSLVRDKILEMIAPRDNEILRDDTGKENGISSTILLAKDFLNQCANMLSVKADNDLLIIKDPHGGQTNKLCFNPAEVRIFNEQFYT